MSILVCGSLAFDSIAVFPGRFSEQILPSQLHILNVSFLVPELRREWGGCAGNIAYNIAGLGGEAIVVATVGSDGGGYVERLQAQGIATSRVRRVEAALTAQAYIVTDADNNQITAFHPGAMQHSHETRISADCGAALAIVAPDGREAMLQHAEQLARAAIPFVFDPGQGLPMFDGAELRRFIDLATWVAVNDYEARMLTDRTGLEIGAIAAQLAARATTSGVVVTLGAEGCEVWQDRTRTPIAAAAPSAVVDPTGCGDAFRGALLLGLERGLSLARAAAWGNRLGAIKIAQRGGQNHTFDTASPAP